MSNIENPLRLRPDVYLSINPSDRIYLPAHRKPRSASEALRPMRTTARNGRTVTRMVVVPDPLDAVVATQTQPPAPAKTSLLGAIAKAALLVLAVIGLGAVAITGTILSMAITTIWR